VRVLVKTKSVSLTINGKEIRAIDGEKILWVALDNDIYIPNLCAIRESNGPLAACRLCFVELEGKDMPVTACTTPVAEGMVINTQGPKALRLSPHCSKSGSCELQKIAKHLGVKLKTKRFRKILPELPIDSSSPVFIYDPNKCVLCGRCVWICQEKLGIGEIGFAYRGFRRMVTTFGDQPMGESKCQNCREIVDVCPVGALVFKGGN